jgi:hypothetical protein
MGFFTFVAQAALEPVILLPLPPRWLGLQTCFNLPGQHGYFTSKRQVWGSAKNSGYNANLGLVSTPMKMKASTMHEPEWAAAESERGGGSWHLSVSWRRSWQMKLSISSLSIWESRRWGRTEVMLNLAPGTGALASAFLADAAQLVFGTCSVRQLQMLRQAYTKLNSVPL